MSLSVPRLSLRIVQRFVHISSNACPMPAKIQVSNESLPGKPQGYLKYVRLELFNYVRDPKFKNETSYLFFHDLHKHIILKGFWVIAVGYIIAFIYMAYISLNKIEIMLDKKSTNEFGEVPHYMSWEKIRNNYWKKSPTMMYNSLSRRRLPIMEIIQDDMLEELKKRKKNGEIQLNTEHYKL